MLKILKKQEIENILFIKKHRKNKELLEAVESLLEIGDGVEVNKDDGYNKLRINNFLTNNYKKSNKKFTCRTKLDGKGWLIIRVE